MTTGYINLTKNNYKKLTKLVKNRINKNLIIIKISCILELTKEEILF
jgi:hypothetical protein